jgi:nicotinate-nucleotide pyrophosphorylase (carboxylating)
MPGISSRSLEVDTLDQLAEALEVGVAAVLLDNITLERCAGRWRWSAAAPSPKPPGGSTSETAPAIAATGVDLISCGWITHSAPILDLGLDIAG